jgi:hypothetical protein
MTAIEPTISTRQRPRRFSNVLSVAVPDAIARGLEAGCSDGLLTISDLVRLILRDGLIARGAVRA